MPDVPEEDAAAKTRREIRERLLGAEELDADAASAQPKLPDRLRGKLTEVVDATVDGIDWIAIRIKYEAPMPLSFQWHTFARDNPLKVGTTLTADILQTTLILPDLGRELALEQSRQVKTRIQVQVTGYDPLRVEGDSEFKEFAKEIGLDRDIYDIQTSSPISMGSCIIQGATLAGAILRVGEAAGLVYAVKSVFA